MSALVTGIYYNRHAAESAVDKLEALGYERDDINVLMHDRTRTKEFADLTGTAAGGHEVSTGAKVGASIVGTLAAIVSSIAAKRNADDRDVPVTKTTAMPSPGATRDAGAAAATPRAASAAGDRADDMLAEVEPAVRYGGSVPPSGTTPVAAGPLAATLVAAGLGGLIGALVGAGVDKKLAKQYEEDLIAGGIVIGVAARSDNESRVREILRNDMRNSQTTKYASDTLK